MVINLRQNLSATRNLASLTNWQRNISKTTSIKDKHYVNELGDRILKLVFPRRSAGRVLQNWVDEGRVVTVPQLSRISRELLKRRRFEHAFEIFAWIEAQDKSQMTASDHAAYLQLIVKIKGLAQAESYFENLPDTISRKATCVPLLHAFVKEKSIDKAEAHMSKICNSGLAVTPHSYNEMMKLYMATSQPEKVLSVIQLMKENQIFKTVLSYNLWMRACGETSGVESVEIVYKEMKNDKNVLVGWSSLCTLAEIYVKSGLVEQATVALRYAEDKMSLSSPLAYFFLITMYTSLGGKDEVLRLWKVVKGVTGRITCANYMSILVCLVKLGDIKEAEKIFLEWESQCKSYDVRVSNILLGAYARKGLMGKAESLHLRTLEKGGSPNYKTWEILMEGWIKCQRMDKVIHAMNRCIPNLKQCRWRPSPDILIAVAEYFEKTENFEDAAKYLQTIRSYGLASIPIYKSLLKMHLNANKPTKDILQLMLNDGIEMDDQLLPIHKLLMHNTGY